MNFLQARKAIGSPQKKNKAETKTWQIIYCPSLVDVIWVLFYALDISLAIWPFFRHLSDYWCRLVSTQKTFPTLSFILFFLILRFYASLLYSIFLFLPPFHFPAFHPFNLDWVFLWRKFILFFQRSLSSPIWREKFSWKCTSNAWILSRFMTFSPSFCGSSKHGRVTVVCNVKCHYCQFS